MPRPVIVDAIRTPMGRGIPTGSLASVHPVDLLAQLLRALLERNQLDAAMVDDVIVGCVSQVGEQSATPGRLALLAAGFPDEVPATTIDRKCGSGQQAIHFAAQGVMAGVYDIVIAAGVESMSRVPMGSARIGQDPFGPALDDRYPLGFVPQGLAAEVVAARWKLSRDDLDAYAASSHRRAAAFAPTAEREIVPIATPDGTVTADETVRPETSPETLRALLPCFVDATAHARFPELTDWRVTAGNSSQITDGAAAILITSEQTAARLGLTPMSRFVAFDVCGADPIAMLTAPIPATRRVLEKAGLSLDDIDHFEVNEAFASVPLAWQAELRSDPAKLNPCGGAIALGHPLGASGVRLMTTMLNGLRDSGGRFGLQTMCEAGGMANAVIIERL